LDLKEIKRLLDMMAKSDVQEVEIEEEGRKIRIRFREAEARRESGVPAPLGLAAAPMALSPEATHGNPAPLGKTLSMPEGTVLFASPMVGTFYRAPAPGAEPFVNKGDRVKEGATLCIVEAMKVMNEIKAEMEAEVLDVLVKNEEPVEYGQPLMVLRRL